MNKWNNPNVFKWRFAVILVVLSVVSVCYGEVNAIPNTKEEGCVDNVCGSVCSYNGVQIFSGGIHE